MLLYIAACDCDTPWTFLLTFCGAELEKVLGFDGSVTEPHYFIIDFFLF